MFIDTHAHLTMPEYTDLNEVLTRARDAKITAIVNASFDLKSSKESLKLAQEHDFIYAAVGIHPHDADKVDENAIAALREMAKDKKVVAIGETGLDYHYHKDIKDLQIEAFRKFLKLAQELNKPVIVHCREAQEDTINTMKEENRGGLRGVFHCFAGDDNLIDFAKEIGFYISFTGNVTFKKADKVRENVSKVPLEMMLLETDCPYLAPEPNRGKRNEPSYIPIIARAIADIKGISIEELAAATTKNAGKLFLI
ncbi:MAG: TatD family hydrolase [Candidatus Margulisiibacteriota bacterium]